MFTVYVLVSKTSGLRNVGQTGNLTKRINNHNQGLSRYTKNRGPWQLTYAEEYPTRSAALKREKFLESGQGREILNDILN